MKRYSEAGLAGCVQQRTCRETGATISVYNAEQQGLDTGDGATAWYTLCETHGQLCGHATLALARELSSRPSMWCIDCSDEVSS